ncbi:hypothetical protein HanXRQr2_Chr07g0287311 [Helianthus annuus]|uniref:Uncharacterized protein n=1 Tax=Helianthus annuus TaxID=4232 RepID=A0A9K3IJC7_HELAN|nr:hypothetical protein HanXRQr2_Chr07g0287311 [Helianthus annuus]KAJ0904114.1 hypothetical protein HanPSC8_Chr07g0278111 [Helianthus annuus]
MMVMVMERQEVFVVSNQDLSSCQIRQPTFYQIHNLFFKSNRILYFRVLSFCRSQCPPTLSSCYIDLHR